MTDPLAQIDITIPCNDNVGSGNTPVVYSEDLLLIRSQWGFEQANAYRQGGIIVNGLAQVGPTPGYFCPGAEQLCGDPPASVHSIRASADVKEWVVAVGLGQAAIDCSTGDQLKGLMFWRWGGTRFQYQGLIEAFVDPTPAPSEFRLVGDFAYCINSPHNAWLKFDLTNATYQEVATAPAEDRQTNIAGFTYRFEKQDVKHMRFVREGAPVANNFYPDEDVKRKQDCSIEWNVLKWLKAHNPTLVIPPTVLTPQVFDDVPPTDQFYESINSLGAAGIVVGRP